MIFKIGNYSLLDSASSNAIYSSNIYQMDEVKQFVEWTDANYAEHREYVRTKIGGSLEVVFENATKYNAFLAVINASVDGLYTVEATITNTGETKIFEAYITTSASIQTNAFGDPAFWNVTIEVSEK